ncbi:MAG: hypothetical protein Q9224_005613 [Gallowayella concinna]
MRDPTHRQLPSTLMMRSIILTSIIGTAAFAVHGVLGAALPVAAIGRSIQYEEVPTDTIGTRDENGPNTVIERHEPEKPGRETTCCYVDNDKLRCDGIVFKGTCSKQEDGTIQRGDLPIKPEGGNSGNVSGASDKGEVDKRDASAANYATIYGIRLRMYEAAEIRPFYQSTDNKTCIFYHDPLPQRLYCAEIKIKFSWVRFSNCYTQAACPQKRDAIPEPKFGVLPNGQVPMCPGTGYRQPEDNRYYKSEAQKLAKSIVIHKDGNCGCFVLHDPGYCWMNQDSFTWKHFWDCYKNEPCPPQKRDAIPGQLLRGTDMVPEKLTSISQDQSQIQHKEFISIKFSILAEEAMSFKPLVKGTQNQCFTLRKDFLENCKPLRKKATFTWDLFFYCYIQGNCPKKRDSFPVDADMVAELNVETSSVSTPGDLDKRILVYGKTYDHSPFLDAEKS